MAEVGQRLGHGAYRLCTFRNTQCYPVFKREHESLQVQYAPIGAAARGEATESDPGWCEHKPVLKSKDGQRKTPTFSGQERESRHKRSPLLYAASWDSGSKGQLCGAYRSVEPVRHGPSVNLAVGSMADWGRKGLVLTASFHPDTSAPCQQLRGYSTDNRITQRRLKRHPHVLHLWVFTRSSSWNSNNNNNTADTPPLYRSRTAYYDILRVSPSATQSQIKTAYYRQSFIYHPDKNPASEEAAQRFSEISEAYTVLGNISLRRKYDRGILSQTDVRSAGRPSTGEAPSRAPWPQQPQQKARQFSQAGGKPMFDFDAFFQAHYGQQLQREKELRARRAFLQKKQKENFKKWNLGKMMEMTVAVLLGLGGVIFISLHKP